MENVHLPKFTKNVNNIQGLSDRPNTADGLTAQGLKEKFDQAGMDIKGFLNEELIIELETFFQNCIATTDSRLTDSRKCNNTFDDAQIARQNLQIKSGTSLPSLGTEGDLFFLY